MTHTPVPPAIIPKRFTARGSAGDFLSGRMLKFPENANGERTEERNQSGSQVGSCRIKNTPGRRGSCVKPDAGVWAEV